MAASRSARTSRSRTSGLGTYQRRYDRLRRKLARVGYLASGTIRISRLPCGKPNCACQTHPRRRHGPYYVWTSKVKGRSVCRMLNPREAKLYLAWIQNRRHLDRTVEDMMEVSRDVAAVLLADQDGFIPGR